MTEADTGPLELYSGAHGKVMAVRLADGSLPALDFLEGLDQRSQQAFKALFARQLDHGQLLTRERFRMLDDKDPHVFEWKVHNPRALRLYCIHEGSTWYATHGGPKVGETRGVKREVKRARSIYAEGSEA